MNDKTCNEDCIYITQLTMFIADDNLSQVHQFGSYFDEVKHIAIPRWST